MIEIFKSASRIGMLAVILIACIWFLYVVLKNATSEAVVIWVITIFTNLVTGITTFYYTKKQSNPGVDKI